MKQNNERSVVSTDGVKNQAVLLSSVFVPNPQVILLRTLITLCSTLSPLPRERWITLQLYYYDDIKGADEIQGDDEASEGMESSDDDVDI